MLEDILNQRHLSLYKLSQQSNIPYSTLMDLKTGKTAPDSLSSGRLHTLSVSLGITMDETYALLSQTTLRHVKTQLDYPISMRLRKKVEALRLWDEPHLVEGYFQVEDAYHINIHFSYHQKDYSIPFDGLVTNQRLYMLDTMGFLAMNAYIEKLEFEELYG